MRADHRLGLRHGFCLLQTGTNLLERIDHIANNCAISNFFKRPRGASL
jgi:hypothetical protein